MRNVLRILTIVLLLWALIVMVTGGLNTHIFGIAIRSRDPWRALIGVLALVVVQAVLHRNDLERTFDWMAAMVRRRARLLAAALAAGIVVHALMFGSFGVGGADAYGYVNQAYDWTSGALPGAIPLDVKLELPEADQLQIPLGYRIGQEPHTMVPTYAPGLPVLMAALIPFGGCGPFFVVPFLAAMFVWCTFRLGEHAAGPLTGVVAAVVLVTTPVVLYQALWPMSDVPAGAFWTAAALFAIKQRRRSAMASGLLTAAGLLVRPNLLPLAVVPFVFVASQATGRERWLRLLVFVACLVPVVVIVGVLNALWFGSPLNSGYGAAREIYLVENIVPNLKLYGSWLWSSQSPWVFLALLPVIPVLRRGLDRRVLLLCAAMWAGVFACYVTYSQFEVWWYLRFLMPGFGALAVLIAAGLSGLARVVRPYGFIAAVTALTLLTTHTLSFATAAGVFGGLRESERRYIDIGEFAAKTLPPNAAMFSMQHSGSLRFYSGRLSLRYDWVKENWARDVVPAVERAGYRPFMVIDDWEAAEVRKHFGLPDGPLPWPVRARMRELGGLTVYDMASSPAAEPPIALEPSTERWCEARHPTVAGR